MSSSPVSVTPVSAITTTSVASPQGVNAPVRLLSEGATGEPVTLLQHALRRVGVPAERTRGVFDASTTEAVKAFQTKQGLTPTGEYDKETRAALRNAWKEQLPLQGPRLDRGAGGMAVKTLEKKLIKAGLLEGKADKYFDAATEAAVKKLELKSGRKVDGIVGRSIWKELGGAGMGSGRDLQLGDKGTAVVALQQRLAKLNLYKGEVSGTFDAATENAVKAFEKRKGMPITGQIERQHWEALRTHVVGREQLAGPSLKKGQSGAAVRLLQTRLKEAGHYSGPLDGKFGDMTKDAVKAFEKKLGVKEDGFVGAALWRALGGAGAGSGPRLKQGSTNTAVVEVLQKRLKELGLYDSAIDGDFGAVTKAAVEKLERQHKLPADGIVGQRLWGILGRHVVTNPSAKAVDTKEPAHDYTRVRRDAGWLNKRTVEMLTRAEGYAAKMGVKDPTFYLVQGSYNSGVSASGGTHDGGGAIDLRTWEHSTADVVKMVKALRMAGFAAWKRGFGDDSFDPHIHAIAIGDRDLASSARNQVAEYFAGGDGLVGSQRDGDSEVGRPAPKWADKYR